jgi:hypothetical protein
MDYFWLAPFWLAPFLRNRLESDTIPEIARHEPAVLDSPLPHYL